MWQIIMAEVAVSSSSIILGCYSLIEVKFKLNNKTVKLRKLNKIKKKNSILLRY